MTKFASKTQDLLRDSSPQSCKNSAASSSQVGGPDLNVSMQYGGLNIQNRGLGFIMVYLQRDHKGI